MLLTVDLKVQKTACLPKLHCHELLQVSKVSSVNPTSPNKYARLQCWHYLF